MKTELVWDIDKIKSYAKRMESFGITLPYPSRIDHLLKRKMTEDEVKDDLDSQFCVFITALMDAFKERLEQEHTIKING